jgi:hypothetical protein
LRDTSGSTAIWLMDGATAVGSRIIGTVPAPWTIAGVADFNRDGRSDILWRNTSTGLVAIWFMDGLNVTAAVAVATVPTSWSIVATGNFNWALDLTGIVWRDTSGNVAIWGMNGATVAQAQPLGVVPANWSIAATGNFITGGTFPDRRQGALLWRDTATGAVAIWFIEGLNLTVASTANIGVVPTDWVVQNVNAN